MHALFEVFDLVGKLNNSGHDVAMVVVGDGNMKSELQQVAQSIPNVSFYFKGVIFTLAWENQLSKLLRVPNQLFLPIEEDAYGSIGAPYTDVIFKPMRELILPLASDRDTRSSLAEKSLQTIL